MLNIKNIFITTGLSVLFGVYSIYTFIEYLKLLDKINKHYTLEFDNVNRVINVIHTDHNNLSLKYNIIETKYNELNAKYDELYVKTTELTLQYNELIQTHTNLLNDISLTRINDDDSLDEPEQDNLTTLFNESLEPLEPLEQLIDDEAMHEYAQQLQTVNEMLEYKINYGYNYDDDVPNTDHEFYTDTFNNLEQYQHQQQLTTNAKPKLTRLINYDDVHINKIIQENFMEPDFIDTLHFDYDNVKTEYNRVKQSDLINYPYEDVPDISSLNSSYSSVSNTSQRSNSSYSSSKPENYKVLVRTKSNSVLGDLWIGLTQKFF
jgi:hypothetical protein